MKNLNESFPFDNPSTLPETLIVGLKSSEVHKTVHKKKTKN